MNKKIKLVLLAVVAIFTAFLVSSCNDSSPYALFDESGYQISVKYDANGGEFADKTTVIIDTYAMDSLPTRNGTKVAKLVAPEDEIRGGKGKTFSPSKNGYQFVGWYTQRKEVKNPQTGEISYEYSGYWDFKNDRLKVDSNKKDEYSSSAPVLTLYAGWVPEFEFEFYNMETNELIDKCKVKAEGTIDIPQWDDSGVMNYYYFPQIEGETFDSVYYEDGTRVSGDVVKHLGKINLENATAENPVTKIYISTMKGEWRAIKTAKAFASITLTGNYVITEDIDLADQRWADLYSKGKFKGQLVGKKEDGTPVKIKNLSISHSVGANSVGLFGSIEAGAVIKNIEFENATLNLNKQTTTSDIKYGLLAGTISSDAILENVKITGKIALDGSKLLSRPIIGLVCGAGDRHKIDYSGITCEIVGEGTPRFTIEVNGNDVTYTKIENN